MTQTDREPASAPIGTLNMVLGVDEGPVAPLSPDQTPECFTQCRRRTHHLGHNRCLPSACVSTPATDTGESGV